MNDKVYAKSNGLSLAALIFGILALLGSFTVVLTPFNASLAIMFSWLSRGDKRMSRQAFAGNILAVVSIVISLAVVAVLIGVLLSALLAAINGLDSISLQELFRNVYNALEFA